MARRGLSTDALLPRLAPLRMPKQRLNRGLRCDRPGAGFDIIVARAGLLGATALMTLAFGGELYGVLSHGIITPLQVLFLALSSLAFGWLVLGLASTALGFFHLFYDGAAGSIEMVDEGEPLATRTALLFPIYKEQPSDVAGTIEAIGSELAGADNARHFDAFVLSDTPDEVEANSGFMERKTFTALRRDLAGRLKVFYRRRSLNTAKKAGNIQDWIEQFGARYDHFIIFDADSVMSGETVVSLARTMEARPNAGLIQTVPRLTGGTTYLQKLQQFAAAIYGPASAAGLAAWHGADGNYWGHNAIIRTTAFAGSAGLPELPGKAPFGGHLQSHDFVEAALMRRAGWGIYMVGDTGGSFEGSPPALGDLICRDRRWAQGNMQHLVVASSRGVTGMGRSHFLWGAASYLASAVWAGTLIVGLILAAQGQQVLPTYFKDERTLFPIWPVTDPGASLRLFLGTLAVVLLPKILGLGLVLRGNSGNPYSGRKGRAAAGVGAETVFSMLIAPILMVTQTWAVIEILLGRDSGWSAQSRGGEQVRLIDSVIEFKVPCLIGLAATAACLWVSFDLALWMSPILLGTVFSGPLVWFVARPAQGWLQRVLCTPDEWNSPVILDRANVCQRNWAVWFRSSGSEFENNVLAGAGRTRAA